MKEAKPKVDFVTFTEAASKIEIKIGTVHYVHRLNKQFLLLHVDLNEGKLRNVVSRIGLKFANDEAMRYLLLGKQFPFITNLEPAVISKETSEAMIMLPEDEEGNVQFPGTPYKPGSVLL